jgi:hypothetical protein
VRWMVKKTHQMGHEERKTKREKSINPSNNLEQLLKSKKQCFDQFTKICIS